MFHALCRNCADCFIGSTKAPRSEPAWQQAYRAADHRYAAEKCKDQRVMRKFPKSIGDFGSTFYVLQVKRVLADYDPASRFTRSEVLTDINAVVAAIRAFHLVPVKHRRAFAAWVTIRTR